MLKILYGNRIEGLADRLIDAISAPQDSPDSDPLALRTVVVPHPEMGRWLARRMARRTGICGNVGFELPTAALWRTTASALQGFPAENPLAPDVLTLRIHQFLRSRTETISGPLADYLSGRDDLAGFRFARRLATLFDQYLLYRPEWVLDWESGDQAASHWQAAFWRQLVADDEPHWPRLLERFFALDEVPTGPPLQVFATSGLAPPLVQLLNRLGQSRPVDLYLWTPCREYWGDAATGRARTGSSSASGHHLLGSLGAQLRDYFDGVQELEAEIEERFTEDLGDGVLGTLGRGLLDFQEYPLPEGEDELQVHGCHARRREVEICHDRLLDLFELQPDLQPEEVIVTAPDLDRYAPLIRAVFGSVTGNRRIPFRLLGHGAALPVVAATLLDVLKRLSGPLTAQAVVDLLRHDRLAARFGIHPDQRVIIRDWLLGAGARDAGEGGEGDKFSWDTASQRLMLARFVDDPWWTGFGIRAAGTVTAGESDLLEGLVALLDRLDRFRLDARRDRPIQDWSRWLVRLLDAMVSFDRDAINQREAIDVALARIRRRARIAGMDCPVGFPLVCALLEEELQEVAAGSTGQAGGVTFGAASAVRLIPCRVRFALGMNDGEFPSVGEQSDLDLIARHPRPGDRSRRNDDRQIFLEWLSTTDRHLLMSYQARHPRDNSARECSPLLRELNDHLDRCGGGPALQWTEHPAQPFSPRYGAEDQPFTYQTQFVPADQGVTPVCEQPLDEEPAPERVLLEDLRSFFQLPARHFFARRLGLRIAGEEDELPDLPPVDLGPLEAFLLRSRLLQERPDALGDWLRSDVTVPDTPLGEAAASRLRGELAELRQRIESVAGDGAADTIELDLSLPSVALSGSVGGIFPSGHLAVRPAAAKPAFLLASWISHLALNVSEETACDTFVVSLGSTVRLPARQDAGEHLERLLAWYRRGEQLPLRLYPRASHEYVATWMQKGRDSALARANYVLHETRFPDIADPWVRMMLAEQHPFDEAFHQIALAIWLPVIESMESL